MGQDLTTLTIRIDRRDLLALKAIARANHRAVSQEARKALSEYIRQEPKRNEAGNER